MEISYLQCDECNRKTKELNQYRCSCGGSLSVQYDFSNLNISWMDFRNRDFSHWRYTEFYPDFQKIISMNEGGTPLLKSNFFSKELKVNLFFKIESTNPTGSFKDRGSTIEISHSLTLGKKVAVASTGNMGASVSSYCASSQIPCRVYIPLGVSKTKVKQIEFYGGEVIHVDGDYSFAAKEAHENSIKHNFQLAGDYHFRCEGEKSVAFEIIDQLLRLNESPDFIVLPVGNGTLAKSVWKGINEFKEAKLIRNLPRIVGVQTENCSTVSRAFLKEWRKIHKVGNPVTVAGAIACGDPLDGFSALKAIKDSGGFAIEVSEREILNARRILAKNEGVFAEESGSVSLAGILKEKLSFEDKLVVSVVTGHGLKSL